MKNFKLQLAAVLAFISFAVAGFAYANPSYFAIGVTTNSAATSTPAFMTPGFATSTVSFDSYSQTTNGGVPTKAEFAGVLANFCGSSTVAVLKMSVEYSNDNVDWYRDYILSPDQAGTTSAPYIVGTPYATQWTYASSTFVGGAASSTNPCSTAAIKVPTPFRYMRIVNTLTGANGSIWESIVPTKERQ